MTCLALCTSTKSRLGGQVPVAPNEVMRARVSNVDVGCGERVTCTCSCTAIRLGAPISGADHKQEQTVGCEELLILLRDTSTVLLSLRSTRFKSLTVQSNPLSELRCLR